jgi:hypothetical protein
MVGPEFFRAADGDPGAGSFASFDETFGRCAEHQVVAVGCEAQGELGADIETGVGDESDAAIAHGAILTM